MAVSPPADGLAPGGPAAAPAEVTIAVVSWNTRTLLAACLASLEADVRSGWCDVWVVDNASSDGSADLVRAEFPWVRLIASEENLGFGPAVNLVADRTRSAWLVPSNSDIRVEPGALRALVAAGTRDPALGAVAPRLILPDGTTQHSVLPFPSIAFTAAYVSGLTTRIRALAVRWCIDGGFDPDRERDVPWAVGAFLAVRRTAWTEIGGFDPHQWMYAEDLDLGWRLHRAGWRTRYLPAARVHHDESAATTQAWGSERYVRWHASSYAWLARRRGPWFARVIAVINVAGFAGRSILATRRARRGDPAALERRQRARDAARAHMVGLRRRASLRATR